MIQEIIVIKFIFNKVMTTCIFNGIYKSRIFFDVLRFKKIAFWMCSVWVIGFKV